MDELTAPQQNRLLAGLSNLLRRVEQDSGPEFLPRGLDVMGLVRQLALPSAETVEKMSYGDPLFRMPTQSNIPITTDRGYLAEVLGMLPAVPAASRATTRLSNEAADALVRQITGRSDATAMRALEEIGQISPVPQITTYHGSPYLFRQFDPMKKGTGEGAQAYGVGAGYTAEARPVAEEYRKMLTSWRPNQIEASLIESGLSPELANTYAQFAAQTKGKAPSFESFKQLISEKSPSPYIEQFRESLRKELPDLEKALAGKSGYLYKGEIPDEMLPSFLDWDKPLSQQSDEVQNVLKRRIVDVQPTDKFDMGGNARLRDNRDGQYDKTSSSPWILETLDSSGTKAFGLTQKDVDRMFGAKDAKDLTGEQIYARLTQEMGSQEAASDYLSSIGVRGIRYLDQGSRGEGKGTSNFIPFSPEDYRIQEINDRPIEEFISQGLL